MNIVVISKDNCGYCLRAKALLEKLNISYTERKVGVDISRDEIVEKYPIMKTVPIITVDDKLIGGFTQLEERCKSGSLNLENL